MQAPSYLVIDWGTTNFRAYLISDTHQVIDYQERPMGLLQIKDRQFARALSLCLDEWLGSYQSLPIFMAGMVGSQLGWVNVDYVTSRAGQDALIENRHAFTLPWGAIATIMPGVSYQSEDQQYDVMRGEEVQVYGLLDIVDKESVVAILPGTHSKHVVVNKCTIGTFSTFMTGELFSLLSEHSILAKELPKQVHCEAAFVKGVKEGSRQDNLLSQLFSVRTQRLFQQSQEEVLLEYLSGMLIGYELGHSYLSNIYIVGQEDLCRRYQIACQHLEITSQYINGDDAFLTGMINMIKNL